jgi:hypothetical protein
MTTHFDKYFTLKEAQALLLEIKPRIEEIARLKVVLDSKGYDVHKHRYFGGMGPNGQKIFPSEMERLVEIVTELNKLGVQVKDMNAGLIDFPATRPNGEEVLLCYRLPESQIGFWHTLDGGFAGRRPVTEL